LDKSSNSRRNRSTSPKGVKRSNNGSDGGASSNTPVDEKKKKKAMAVASSSAAVTNGSSLTLETKNSAETTDLDRIMAQELFKKNGVAASTAGSGGGGGSGGGVSDGNASSGSAAEKKDGNTNAVMKKFEELNVSTTAAATNTSSASANAKSGGGSKVTSSSTSANNATSASKRTNNTTTTTSSGTDGASNNSSNNISSANTKIPISVTTSSATQNDDDEFDAEIDMVGFFAKSSQTKLGASSSASANNSSSSDSSGADSVPPSSKHSRSHITHKLKKTETDDHMPEELVGSADLLSPSNKSSSEKNVGDNLLSSLDAFEASFASAFPETSFSIKSEVPSTTQLDMSFDVPVFDPFFKSPVNKDRDGALTSSSLHQTPPKSKSSTMGASGGGNSNAHKDGMKSQLKDLFPDSALTTSPKRGLDLTFDSTFPDVDIGSGSSSNTNKSGKGKSSLSADKLDSAFSRAHATPTTSTKTAGVSSAGGGGGGSSKSLSSNEVPDNNKKDWNIMQVHGKMMRLNRLQRIITSLGMG